MSSKSKLGWRSHIKVKTAAGSHSYKYARIETATRQAHYGFAYLIPADNRRNRWMAQCTIHPRNEYTPAVSRIAEPSSEASFRAKEGHGWPTIKRDKLRDEEVEN